MRNNRRWIQGVILAAVLLIGGYTIGSSLFAEENIPREGSTAPDFSLQGLDGKTYRLSDLRGKPVMVNFWGTWCEPCAREMPAIQRQYDKWKDQGLVVLGLNLDESAVTVQSFVRQNEVTFPVLFDKELRMRDRYAVRSYPTTFFVDPDGKIVKIAAIEMDEPFIDATVRSMLKP
ncbi:thiol-disulfide oxidoreductase ResA [Paenibacillus flagellatus]|uniref:Thiol-disulfide oxidoreductase n=1 Tax=Paenibacillus flagellatus TaxID=2211139 RepID=A0A2V5KTD6_9BACL|nr:thiol-disulfide oxidoreductase ResA [Paenibacillus flagellatus]PYI54977.1 thiol-disulfide oxidoreductase [Paenibacillus flagellatus]